MDPFFFGPAERANPQNNRPPPRRAASPPLPPPHSSNNQTLYASLWIITIQFDRKSGPGAINLAAGLSKRRREWLGWRLPHHQLTHINPNQPSCLAPLTRHFINDNEQCTNLTLQACCQEPTRAPRLIRQSQGWKKKKEREKRAVWGEVISLPLTSCEWFESLSNAIIWPWSCVRTRRQRTIKCKTLVSRFGVGCAHLTSSAFANTSTGCVFSVAMGTSALHTRSATPRGERRERVCNAQSHGSCERLPISVFSLFWKLMNFPPT